MRYLSVQEKCIGSEWRKLEVWESHHEDGIWETDRTRIGNFLLNYDGQYSRVTSALVNRQQKRSPAIASKVLYTQ